MRKYSVSCVIVATALTLATDSLSVLAAAPPASTPAAKAKAAPAAVVENAITYDDLKQHVGQHVIVHTTFKTTRSGVLTKFSNTELALLVDTPGGPTEMTIPKNTVSNVALPATPAAEAGKPSAKKN